MCRTELPLTAAGAEGHGADSAAEAGDQQPDQAAGAGGAGCWAVQVGRVLHRQHLTFCCCRIESTPRTWGQLGCCFAVDPAACTGMPALQGAAVGLAEEADLEELIRQKEALVAERDGQVQAIVALRGEVRTGGGVCWWAALIPRVTCKL